MFDVCFECRCECECVDVNILDPEEDQFYMYSADSRTPTTQQGSVKADTSARRFS